MRRLREIQLRHAQYYESLLRALKGKYTQGGDLAIQALELIEVELPNIKHGYEWASARMGEFEKATLLCMRFPDAGAYLLKLRLHPEEWLAWQQDGLEAARYLVIVR